MTTKIEIVNQAIDLIRISGLTVNPTPEDNKRSLRALENYLLSLELKGVYLGYHKESEGPDANTDSGITDNRVHAVAYCLAALLAPYYGKVVPSLITSEAADAYRSLLDAMPPINCQNRNQPRGQGFNPGFERSYLDQYMAGQCNDTHEETFHDN